MVSFLAGGANVLGCWRFLLAVMVVIGHSYAPVQSYFGVYAVYCFYALSGYLITLVLHEKYRGIAGRIAFVKNRFLRLYPAYWTCLVISIAAGVGRWWGPADFHRNFFSWLSELTMVGIGIGDGPHFIGQTWTVWIELFFYALMAIGLSAREWSTYVWLLGSLAVHAYFVHHRAYWFENVFQTRSGASLPFAVGASAYWFSRRVLGRKCLAPHWAWMCNLAIVAMLAHAVLATPIWRAPYYRGLYANLLLAGAVLVFSQRTLNTPRWLAHVDRLLGDLAYPFYLIHYTALQAAAAMTGHAEVMQPNLEVTLPGLALAVPASVVIWWLIDRPIARMRNRVRVDAAVTEVQQNKSSFFPDQWP